MRIAAWHGIARARAERSAAGRTRRYGFTLIELLVVVAIIALLISILLPSLGRAREQTKQAICKANLRSIGQAFSMYAEEYRGKWPPVVDSLGQQNRWPVPFFQARIVYEELNQYDTNGAQLKNGSSRSIFLCPSEIAPRSISKWNNKDITVDRVEIGGSYAYSGEIHRDGNDLKLGNALTPPFLKTVDTCKRSGEIISLMENFKPLTTVSSRGWRYYRDGDEAFWFAYRSPAGIAIPPTQATDDRKTIGAHHLGNMNVLFIDSHVETTQPGKIAYNQVSWTRWSDDQTKPPGGQ